MYCDRHVSTANTADRLRILGLDSLESLVAQALPDAIRDTPNDLPARSEAAVLAELRGLAQDNTLRRSLIGNGYYQTITPAVIQRTVFENPAWYTAYTPYQPEISQGRLEALFYFQTLICELTGLPLANASLLDEATAVVEAALMLIRTTADGGPLAIYRDIWPQTQAVLAGRLDAIGVQTCIVDTPEQVPENARGIILQSPNRWGICLDLSPWHATGHPLVLATDLLALTHMKSPADWGVDIAVGSTQRFGVPVGYGGPHAAFIAAKTQYKRELPGRIVGLSKTRDDQPAYRLALQTREQHIRRGNATSNICTAQALLAIMAVLYAMYHGPSGLKKIANRVHQYATQLRTACLQAGVPVMPGGFFDTITLCPDALLYQAIRHHCDAQQLDLYYDDHQTQISIACDETTDDDLIAQLIHCIQDASAGAVSIDDQYDTTDFFQRTDAYLTQAVFNMYHTETELMRYIRRLESRDLSLVHSMIPLGSCTMKLNSAAVLQAVSWPEFSQLHPFCPLHHAAGYHRMMRQLESDLAVLTGMQAVSLQPNSGAQGELAGLLVMKAYFQNRGEIQRRVIIIPDTAHGTNPASARLAGLDVKTIVCDETGRICNIALKTLVSDLGDRLFGMMITYPSTCGVFDETVQESCAIINQSGGLVYMDGANMNAQLGITTPRKIGVAVCHLNLHKTFAIPHGGGGPGVGPIAVIPELAPFLPHAVTGIAPLTAAPWGSASILLISYAYIRLMGLSGLKTATQYALLNANYIACRLKDHYTILYTNEAGYVAHELVLDCRPFRKTAGITVDDIAKRLMDYGFHAPTMSWPVPGTLMIEPTESESLAELDRFCEAMIAIRASIHAIESGAVDRLDNPLKQAPHTPAYLMADDWPHAYSRKEARATGHLAATVLRLDHAYGDRNLVCACGS